MWLFGSDVGGGGGGRREAVVESDVGGGDLIVVGGGGDRGCGDGGVVGIVVIWDRCWWWRWRCGWSKITIGKEKHYLKGSQPG